MKRFDATLFENEESKLAKVAAHYQALDELVDVLDPSQHRDMPKDATKLTRDALQLADKLEALVPGSAPVFMIRAAERWARLAPNGLRKTIVIENADRMLDASRNALLKILEEPPATVTFILVSSRKGAMIPTILSRVRSYRFRTRSADEENALSSRVFKSPAPEGLARFFDARMPSRDGELEACARALVASMCAEIIGSGNSGGVFAGGVFAKGAQHIQDGMTPEAAVRQASDATKAFGASDDAYEYAFVLFLSLISDALRDLVRSPLTLPNELDVIARWTDALRDAEAGAVSFNLNPTSLAERLLAAMRRGV